MNRWSIVTSSDWINRYYYLKDAHISHEDDEYYFNDNRYVDEPAPNFKKDHVENFADIIYISDDLLDILDNLYYSCKQYGSYSRGSKQALKDLLVGEALDVSDGDCSSLNETYWRDSWFGENFLVIWLPYNIVGLTKVSQQAIQDMKRRDLADGIIEYRLKKMNLVEGVDWIWKFDQIKWSNIIEDKVAGKTICYDWDMESYLALGGDINDIDADLDKFMESIGF